jgi:hypothetical protein
MPQKSNVNEGSSSTSEAGRAGGGAQELARDVKEVAGEAAGQVREVAEARLSKPRRKAADALAGVAKSLRETGEKLDETSGLELDRYAARAADGIERFSDYMRERELSDVVRDVESFARREPALFFGGAFVLGLVGSRFLKSSRARRPSAATPAAGYSPPVTLPETPRAAQRVERASASATPPSSYAKRAPGATSGAPIGPEPSATNGPASGQPVRAQGKP